MLQWIIDNKEWLFGGIGVFAISVILKMGRNKKGNNSATNTVNNNININTADPSDTVSSGTDDLAELKSKTHLLFIDDDGRFQVVNILKKSGWVQTIRIADVVSLDSSEVTSSHILFVDIQGVGKRLKFHDEGLGLAEAIKNKYPEKKVVIYSAQDEGKRFHSALRKADDVLSKNADPYEFQQLTEKLARDYWNSSNEV